jgi:hypothetical protein
VMGFGLVEGPAAIGRRRIAEDAFEHLGPPHDLRKLRDRFDRYQIRCRREGIPDARSGGRTQGRIA